MAIPTHLSGTEALGLVPDEVIAQYHLGEMRNLVYLVIDWSSRSCAWVDPQEDVETPLADIQNHGLTLERILLTHTHFDHVLGLPSLLQRFPDLPVHCHPDDHSRIERIVPSQSRSYQPLKDGDTIRVGSIPITAFHSPGHSRGALIYVIKTAQPYLLSGDTVFIRDCGRTDLPTGSPREMFETLQRIRAQLPPEGVLLPGHQYTRQCASTLETELKTSPPFLCRTLEELERLP